MSPDPKQPSAIPLSYLGEIETITTRPGEAADLWCCAPGANIVHFRAKSEDDLWKAYAGGDPRRSSKASKAGRVLVSFPSLEPYWIVTAAHSVVRHFAKAEKILFNCKVSEDEIVFRSLDLTNERDAADHAFMTELEAPSGRPLVRNGIQINSAADTRFLAKLALGIGYRLFGSNFLATAYGQELRKGFREANSQIRKTLAVKGSGYFRTVTAGSFGVMLRWPGGWLLVLKNHRKTLSLSIIPPSGAAMVVQVTDDPDLISQLEPSYDEGVAWLTVPQAGTGLGPLWLPDYVAHLHKIAPHPELASLDAKRRHPALLPSTGLPRSS